MSEKTFNFLSKYYTFSKKYFPLISLGIFFIIALCKVSTIICIAVYFGLMLFHLISSIVIKRLMSKYVYETLVNENFDEVVNDENTNDTKESN